MASFFRWYNGRLAARPYLTQGVTTAVLFATGDITAQQLVEKRGAKGHDVSRTGRMALYGGCVFGPVATTWLGFLARRVTFRNARVETAARVAADQLLFAPVMIGVFLGSMATMEGKSPPEAPGNYLVYRLLFANVISIGWNSYLSWVNSKGGNKSKDHELVAAPAT
ncbi:Protein required for ethanol metabolism [Trichoderma virens]|nr:Protein required for ethanol metabolism [Trichoderma virens]